MTSNDEIVAALQAMLALRNSVARLPEAERGSDATRSRVVTALRAVFDAGFGGIYTVYVHTPWRRAAVSFASADEAAAVLRLCNDMSVYAKRYIHMWSMHIVIKNFMQLETIPGVTPIPWNAFPFDVAATALSRDDAAAVSARIIGEVVMQMRTLDDLVRAQPWTVAVRGVLGPDIIYWAIDTRTQAEAEALRNDIASRVGPLAVHATPVLLLPGDTCELYLGKESFEVSYAKRKLDLLISDLQIAVK